MTFPRYTENTVRNLLLKELEKRGVKAATEVSYKTPLGMIKPDAFLQNGGNYIIETKLGAEAKLFDAITSLYDYTKYIPVVGGFAILLPEELRRPLPIEWLEHMAIAPKYKYVVTAIFKDKRASQRFTGSLSEAADWISQHVLKPPEYVEPDTSLAISVLNDAVDYVTLKMLQLHEEELEDIFGGKTVFENILQYEEGKYPLEEMRRAATYLLINQILFYHVLSSRDPLTFPRIEEDFLKKPSDLAIYFKRVLQVDYTPTFGFDVASRLPIEAGEVVKNIVKAIKALAPEKIRYDLLGKVFHDLIPFETRKAVAAFYTNNEAAEMLARLSIEDPNAKVMDLACGSGTLLVAAYHGKRELLEKSGKYFGLEEHKEFLEEDLTGIDIMPFAAHLAVVHLSLQSPVYETEKVRIAVWDSTELKPGQIIPAVYRELREAYKRPTLDTFMKGKPAFEEEAYIEKGAVTLEGVGGEAIPLEKVDVVIMNPPFTRQERLPKDYKDILTKRLKEYKNQLHGQLGLYGYFVFLADRFLKVGGRLALVLPATILRIASTQSIRNMLTKDYDVEYIITTYQRAAFSERAQFREILLVAKKKSGGVSTPQGNSPHCLVITLNRLPRDMAEARSFAEYFKGLSQKRPGTTIKNNYSTVVVTIQQELKDNLDNMFRLIATAEHRLVDIWTNLKSKEELTKLSSYLGDEIKLVRGFEMTLQGISPVSAYTTFLIGDPTRAIKKHDQWVVKSLDRGHVVAENRFTHTTIRIPARATVRALRRLSGVRKINLSENLDFMVTKPFKGCSLLFESRSDVDEFLFRWRGYVESRKTNLVFMRRFDLSAPGTILFSYYSPDSFTASKMMWCFKELPERDAKILTLWFNSTLNVLQVFLDRIETRGAFIGFSKYVLFNTLILDPNKLAEDQRETLLKTFEEIKNIEFASLLKQLEHRHPARKKIDEAILKILGFKEEEIENLLGYLYPALHREILRLKELMSG